MKKLILVVLLSFVLSQQNKCKPNEMYNPEKKICVVLCNEGEYYNNATSTCEKCDAGQQYNQIKKVCEDIKKRCRPNQMYDEIKKRCVRKVVKCRNGRLVNGQCMCRMGYTLKNGDCHKDVKTCPRGYYLKNGKCVKRKRYGRTI